MNRPEELEAENVRLQESLRASEIEANQSRWDADTVRADHQRVAEEIARLKAQLIRANADANKYNAEANRLTRELEEARALVEVAIEALDHIDCGNAQCRDGYGGCDRRCSLHARATIAHLRTQSTPVAVEEQPK